MSHVFHRQTRSDPPVAVRGEGLYIVDEARRHYLDASGGAAVSCLGHGHPAVVAAIREQAEASLTRTRVSSRAGPPRISAPA